jgi:hypothetical protein
LTFPASAILPIVACGALLLRYLMIDGGPFG